MASLWVTDIFPPFIPLRRPSLSDLRAEAFSPLSGARSVSGERIALYPSVKSRLEDRTEVNFGDPTDEQATEMLKAFQMMGEKPFNFLDRVIGDRQKALCRLVISSDFPQPALVWASLLDTYEEGEEYDFGFLTISIPEFPRKHVYVFPHHDPPLEILLGVDYGGEHKMAFLKMFLYEMKRRELGLGLHGALTTFRLMGEEPMFFDDYHAVFLAGSGTGKSTLSSHTYGLLPPEAATFRQDDIVAWMNDGSVAGTEGRGFYVITKGLNPEGQGRLWQGTQSPDTVFENVVLDDDAEPVFSDTSISGNPRAAIPRTDVNGGESVGIDAPRLDAVFMLCRMSDIFPPIMRLSPERAAYEFLMGRTVETAAADPDRAGAPRNVPGWNPFMMDPRGRAAAAIDETNRFYALAKRHLHVQFFLVNTGCIGTGNIAAREPCDITVADSTALIREALCGALRWSEQGFARAFGGGYEEAADDIPMQFHPALFYTATEFFDRAATHRRNDAAWLQQFRDDDALPALAEPIARLVHERCG